jgi:hypothetical protein
VAVAQLVESRIVIPVVVGSSPISHPNKYKACSDAGFFYFSSMGYCWAIGGVMRKIILMLLLAIVSSNAMAEWVKIAAIHSQESPEIQIAYADPAIIHKNGNLVNMSVLVDHQSGLSKKMENRLDKIFSRTKDDITKSWKVEDEFDCMSEKLRMLSYTAYSEHMGNGEIIPNNMVLNHWGPVIRESIGQALWEFACSKK